MSNAISGLPIASRVRSLNAGPASLDRSPQAGLFRARVNNPRDRTMGMCDTAAISASCSSASMSIARAPTSCTIPRTVSMAS